MCKSTDNQAGHPLSPCNDYSSQAFIIIYCLRGGVYERVDSKGCLLLFCADKQKRKAYEQTVFLWEGKTISDLFINEQIRDREVRVIGADGEQLGVMPTREAMKLAEEAGVDLVKIAPTAKPPVCKIVDYGKFKYEQARKDKEAKKKQKIVEVKEVRLSPNIDTNDLNTKVNNAKKFILKGNKVKVTLRFRGREMAHVQQSKHILDDFYKLVGDIAVVEKPAKLEGRNMSMVLTVKR